MPIEFPPHKSIGSKTHSEFVSMTPRIHSLVAFAQPLVVVACRALRGSW